MSNEEILDLIFVMFLILVVLFLVLRCDCQTDLEKENEAYIKQNCTVLTQTVRPIFTETEYKCNDGSIRKVMK